ncbi:MAG: hypothetical protein KJ893_02695 [Candidatus Omnitrophica bacterium]|nr:hypothetical protein [Candidatus Omnitrophota bacterium]MBU4478677.1 hypothetical protein [Candidatus Omnitrophota bacterium]
MHKTGKTVLIFLGALLIITSGYMLLRIIIMRHQTKMLEAQNFALSREQLNLQEQVGAGKEEELKRDVKITALQNELSGLRDVKNIKELYVNGQKEIAQLNEFFKNIQEENVLLKQSSLTLTNRMQNITNEFTGTLETVKVMKKELEAAKNDKTLRKYQKKLEKNEELLKKAGEEADLLKQKINGLQKENKNSEGEKKIIQQRITALEKEKRELESGIEKTKQDFEKKIRFSSQLSDKLRELVNQLQEKEKQRVQLSNDAERLAREKDRLEGQLKKQEEQRSTLQQELSEYEKKSGMIKVFEKENKDLLSQLARAQDKVEEQKKIIDVLQSEKGRLNKKRIQVNEVEVTGEEPSAELEDKLNKAYALYDTAKAQVVKFSELFMNKEVEIESAKQKIKKLEDEVKSLKEQRIPEELALAGIADKYRQERFKVLNDSLLEKVRQLEKKDEEISALQAAKLMLEERLSYHEKQFGDTNSFYDTLQKQMAQASELLSRREAELMEKNKDLLSLKTEMDFLQSQYKVREQELSGLRKLQRKTMEDLSRTTELNITLQENMTRGYRKYPAEVPEKQKADELKQELELLLSK